MKAGPLKVQAFDLLFFKPRKCPEKYLFSLHQNAKMRQNMEAFETMLWTQRCVKIIVSILIKISHTNRNETKYD